MVIYKDLCYIVWVCVVIEWLVEVFVEVLV